MAVHNFVPAVEGLGVAATEAVLLLQLVIVPFRGVPLLLGLALVVFQDLIDHSQPRPSPGRRAGWLRWYPGGREI